MSTQYSCGKLFRQIESSELSSSKTVYIKEPAQCNFYVNRLCFYVVIDIKITIGRIFDIASTYKPFDESILFLTRFTQFIFRSSSNEDDAINSIKEDDFDWSQFGISNEATKTPDFNALEVNTVFMSFCNLSLCQRLNFSGLH